MQVYCGLWKQNSKFAFNVLVPQKMSGLTLGAVNFSFVDTPLIKLNAAKTMLKYFKNLSQKTWAAKTWKIVLDRAQHRLMLTHVNTI